MCKTLQLFGAVCRIFCYNICNWLCCKEHPVEKQDFSVVCLGLSKSGKTTVMCQLLHEDINTVTPTLGFSFKDIVCEKSVLKVKELGGSEQVLPYWDRYYDNCDGVIYVIDPDCSDEEKRLNLSQFTQATSHPLLLLLPVLILVLAKSPSPSMDENQIHKLLLIDDNQSAGRTCVIQSHHINDVAGIRQSFDNISQKLCASKKLMPQNGAGVVVNQV